MLKYSIIEVLDNVEKLSSNIFFLIFTALYFKILLKMIHSATHWKSFQRYKTNVKSSILFSCTVWSLVVYNFFQKY